MRHDRELHPHTATASPDGARTHGPLESGPSSPVPLPSNPILVGGVDDPAEAAADRMADAALSRLHSDGSDDCSDHSGAHVHRAPAAPAAGAAVGAAGGALDQRTGAALTARRGHGSPLPAPVLERMESAFGRSFSGVRIHDDSAAHELNTSLSAHAFTAGSDIFFGRGAYDPDSPAGRRVLAHELAHTVQSGDTIGRWSLFGEKKTPEQVAEEEKRKEEKQKEKEKKKQEKAEAKKQAQQTKQNAKENRKLESGERKHLSQERKQGKATRKDLAKKIATETGGGPGGSATLSDLHKRFDAQLAKEQEILDELLKNGAPQDEALEEAYRAAWLENIDPELRAVRPPRETAAERLMIEVRQARLEDRLDDDTLERGRLGKMLSKGVEEVYERWESEAERLRTGPPATDPDVADYLAGKTVWEQAGPELRKKRPTDPRVERQARIDARNRLNFGRREPKKETSKLEKAGDVTDAIDSYGSKAVTGVSTGPKAILAKIGKPLDKQLQKEQGFEPDTTTSETTKSLGMVPIIGGPMKTISTAVDRVKAGKKDDTISVKPVSVETQAANGIGSAADVLNDLLSSVNGVLKVAQSISKAATERSARAILGATKACNDGAKTATTMAKDAAELASHIDPGVTASVASVVPGLNIAISVLSIVSNAITLADISMRMSDTNQSLTDARGRTQGAKKVDVMVYPLLHVHSVYAKKLEQACWSTAVSIANLVTSIATVASGGGYGIPAAVQAGVKLVDLLHSVGHFIADQVIVALAKQSRVDSLERLEGAAETQFKRDPSASVDGIVVRAKKGDPVAIKFLESYGVKEDEVKDGKLVQIRGKVLSGIGEAADPAYFYESYVDKIKGVLNMGTSVAGRWSSTGRLAKERNELDPQASQRGWGWRVKMMFKGKEKYARSKAKTSAQKDMKDGIACRVGKFVLLTDPDASELGRFIEQVETLSDQEILNASADPANAEEWRELLVELLQTRVQKAAADKTPATAGA